MFPFEAYRIWIFRTRFKREIPEKWRNLSHRPHNGPVGSFMSLPEEVEEGREIRSIETEVPVIVHLCRLLHLRVTAGIVEVVETQPGEKVPDIFTLSFYTLVAKHLADAPCFSSL